MKNDKIKIGRCKDLALLVRDNCTLYGFDDEPEFTTEYLYSIDLKKGITMDTSGGPIKIEKIRRSDEDLQITLRYKDFRNGTRRAYLALGQEIMIRKIMDKSIPNRYLSSHCSFLITTKEFANKEVKYFYKQKDKEKEEKKKVK